MIVMAGKTSGDSSRRVPGIIFRKIQDSFTTQGLASKARPGRIPRDSRPSWRERGRPRYPILRIPRWHCLNLAKLA
jgi:hypothetical protein